MTISQDAYDELMGEIANLTDEQCLDDLKRAAGQGLPMLKAKCPRLFYGCINIFGENPRNPDDLSPEDRLLVSDEMSRAFGKSTEL